MFWSTDLAATVSKLDELLKNDTATLADVLEDDYTIQEIRNGNHQLIKFLTRQEVVAQLIKGALEPEIDESLPLKEQYKKAHLCAEILSINNEELSKAVIRNEEACSLLFDFLDSRKLNHVIVNFYMKIFSQIISRFPDQVLPRMKESQFLTHCMRSMKHSAVMELLYRIISGLSDVEQQDCVKQWCAESRMVESLCDLLVPEQPPVVHDNVGHLWSELVRMLRDVQYTAECKRSDPLLESLQSERNVRHLMSRMLPDDVEQHRDSVIVNAAVILITLLETNFVPNCPSHQLGMEDRGVQGQWCGGVPIAENELNGTAVWQPDAGRIVETVVAASADRIVNAITDSLKVGDGDIALCSDAWCPLMRLLVLVLDTNHMATHQAVLAAFSSLSINPFKLFLTYVNTRPQLTLFQNLLHRAIAYILYTLSSSPSPLIQYLIKDVDILRYTLAGCETSQADFLHGSSKRMLRGFYMNLASLIKCASESSHSAEFITQSIQASDEAARWESFLKEVKEYEEKNRGDDTGITPPPTSNVVDMAKIDACDVPEPMVSNATQLMDEYEQYLMPRSLAEDVAVSFPCSSHDTEYEVPDITSDCDIAKDFSSIGNEDMFDAMCALRIDTSIPNKDSGDRWPGVSKPKEMDNRIIIDNGDESEPKVSVFWNDVPYSNEVVVNDVLEVSEKDAPKTNTKEERKISKCVIEDKWPQTSSVSSMDFGNWADFTSMKPDDWPPPQSQSENDAWNDTTDDIFLSPTTAALSGGIASVIMAGNIKFRSFSECSDRDYFARFLYRGIFSKCALYYCIHYDAGLVVRFCSRDKLFHQEVIWRTVFGQEKVMKRVEVQRTCDSIVAGGSEMSKRKVLLMGKSGSGKTSMRSIIFANYIARDTNRLGPTMEVEHAHVRFLGNLVLHLWDCGGQEAFMENYLASQKDQIFKNVLIYVFDVESRELEKDYRYYQSCLEALMQNSPSAKVFCLIHKMDLVSEDHRDQVFAEKERDIMCRSKLAAEKFGHDNVVRQCYRSSIWDETLYKAWSAIVCHLVPNVASMEARLKQFAVILDADEVLLFEKATFLVIAQAQIVQHDDIHRFEKVSNIIKQFKLSCSKLGSQFECMCVRNSKFAAFIDSFTCNTFIMVVLSDATVSSAATLMNIRNARKHFDKLEAR
uniref:Uncharacterized protein n=1 Tax=Setaria digitata TaxID=48799 RepID=A0A915Q0Q5_9BILA